MRRNSKQRVKARRETAVRVLEASIKRHNKRLGTEPAPTPQDRKIIESHIERAQTELATVQDRIRKGSPVSRSLKKRSAKRKSVNEPLV